MLQQRRGGLRRVLIGVVGVVILWRILTSSFYGAENPVAIDAQSGPTISQAFVVASIEKDDTAWLYEHFADWAIFQYIVDNPSAQYTVPGNKGHEAMVYLSFIIDTYNNLPDVTVFLHSDRYQWHNDDPLYDGVSMLQKLQLPYIKSQGYVNIRCSWILGCPAEVKLDEEQPDPNKGNQLMPTNAAFKKAFQELFPDELVPSVIGVACCAQFALSRAKIRERPLEDYKRYRQWLLHTPLEDSVSGRIFEYSWHIIFGKQHRHCPNAKDCYCNVFGLCNLECGADDLCAERWKLPPYSTLPKGWPEIGWDGETRGPDELKILQNVSISPAI